MPPENNNYVNLSNNSKPAKNTTESDPPLLALPAPSATVTSIATKTSYSLSSTSNYRNPYHSSREFEERKDAMAGLSNQGATCYLNSLLQTLYMTPSVRRLLYRFRYRAEKHGDEEMCIPLQLQRLFGRLQLGKERAVSTTELTKSFGWTARDSFEQHDVQELCRLLFDAVDKFMSHNGTPISEDGRMEVDQQRWQEEEEEGEEQTALVSDLYTGEMIDYIRSKEDRNEKGELVGRERVDKYMDIQLVVRDVSSVEEALDNYVKPEEMVDDNRWFCEELNRKVDAIKGLKFKSPLPYILTLHLKRFDYDYTTWHRIKLANKVTFPFVLDMHKYVEGKEGNLRYELFSVMIHSGSATGGHYYAYIKNLGDGKWYNFNDSNVTNISEQEVEKMFGMDGSAYKSLYASTNAYMLMYRKIDFERNIGFPSDAEVPADVRDLVAREAEQWEKRKMEMIEQNSKITAVLNFAEDRGYKSLRVEVRKQHTLEEAKQIMVDKIKKQHPDDELLSGLTVDLIRVRQYKIYDRTAGAEMIGDETNLESMRWHSQQHVFVEFRSSVDEPWPEIREKLNVFVTVLDPMLHLFHEGQIMKLENCKLQVFIESIIEGFKRYLKDAKNADGGSQEEVQNAVDPDDEILQPENMQMILSAKENYMTVDLTDLERSATDAGIKDADVLYVEFLSPLSSSELQEKIEEKDNEITLYYVDADDSSREADKQQTLYIDKRKTWLELRQALAENLGRDINQFRICDKYNKLPKRFDDNQVLNDNVFEYSVLYIENESPLAEGEYIFKLFRYTIPHDMEPVDAQGGNGGGAVENGEPSSKRAKLRPVENGKDATLEASSSLSSSSSSSSSSSMSIPPPPPLPPPPRTLPSMNFTPTKLKTAQENATTTVAVNNKTKTPFSPMGNTTIHKDTTLREVKHRIAEMSGHPVQQLRIRVKFYNTLDEVLVHDDKSIEKNLKGTLQDGKQLAVQLLDHEEKLVEGDKIINVQRWYSSVWKFGKMFELVLNRQKVVNMDGLVSAIALSRSVPIVDAVPMERIAVAKSREAFNSWNKKASAEIALLNWTNDSAISIWQPPFHLEEGDLVLFRDKEETEKSPLDTLKSEVTSSSSTLSNGHYAKKTERVLKINTVYDNVATTTTPTNSDTTTTATISNESIDDDATPQTQMPDKK